MTRRLLDGHGLASSLLLVALTGCALSAATGGDAATDAVLADYDWSQPAERCFLPAELNEASGLEHDGRGGLVALHDNASTLYRVGCDGVKALAGPMLDGDFEGVARHADRWYLLTSPGVVHAATLSADGLAIAEGPRRLPEPSRGLAGRCGFEAIAAPAADALLVACKYPRAPRAGMVQLFRIDLQEGTIAPLTVDVTPVLNATGLARLRPSGLAWLPERARLLVLVGKERVLLEVDASGALLAWRRLARPWHRQAEGVAVLSDGGIAIVDEADGRRATLSVYMPRPENVPAKPARGQTSSSRAGRTSMLPTRAGGMREAIWMASSRSWASIR